MTECRAQFLLRPQDEVHRAVRRRSRRLWVHAVAAAAVAAGIAFTLLWPLRPVLLWNASASSRIGLYAVFPPGHPRAGDTAIAWAPPPARRLAAVRQYLPFNVPLVKQVAADAGDRVCAAGRAISINGRPVALRRIRDRSGRRMPWWSGCHVLGSGELFLLSPHAPDAFDGRYFGVTRTNEIVGKARLLWPR